MVNRHALAAYVPPVSPTELTEAHAHARHLKLRELNAKKSAYEQPGFKVWAEALQPWITRFVR